MITAKQLNIYLKPYSIEVNGKQLELNNIIIYEDEKIIAKTQGGWFEPLIAHERLDEIEIDVPKVYLRRTANYLDGKVFVVKDNEYWDKKSPRYTLYLPNEIAEFKHYSRSLSFHYVVCDKYISEKLKAKIEYYIPEIKLNAQLYKYKNAFKEVKDEMNFEIGNEKLRDLIDTLERLNELYEDEIKRLNNLDLTKL